MQANTLTTDRLLYFSNMANCISPKLLAVFLTTNTYGSHGLSAPVRRSVRGSFFFEKIYFQVKQTNIYTYQFRICEYWQDLMVLLWSLLIFFLQHLEICSWSCLAFVATTLPFLKTNIENTRLGKSHRSQKSVFFCWICKRKKNVQDIFLVILGVS